MKKEENEYSHLVVEYATRFADRADETDDHYCVDNEYMDFVRSFLRNAGAVECMLSNFPGDLGLINTICRETPRLPVSLIARHHDEFFGSVSTRHFLSLCHQKSKKFVEAFHDELCWDIISVYGGYLTVNEIDNCAEYLDWTAACNNNFMSMLRVARRHADRMDWEACSRQSMLPVRTMTEFHDRIVWHLAWRNITPDFARKHGDLVDWDDIAENGAFSLGFWKRHCRRLRMELVNKNTKIDFAVVDMKK